MPLRRAALVFAIATLIAVAGCGATRIPPVPLAADTVVLASNLSPADLYAKSLAAFMRVGWEPLTPTEEGFATTVISDGADRLPVALRVEPMGESDAVLTATVDTTQLGAREVLARTARVLTIFRGELSYR